MIATLSHTSNEALNYQQIALGNPVPVAPHAISVSLPTWNDNVGYEEGEKRVVDAMVSGYPRFFIHLSIQKLAQICVQKFGLHGEKCLLFVTKRTADFCRAFMLKRLGANASIRLVEYLVDPTRASSNLSALHMVFFPEKEFSLAKQFWQHTGMGISSRYAEYCLALLPQDVASPKASTFTRPIKKINRHYSAHHIQESTTDQVDRDHTAYLEERYGRNLPFAQAGRAKRALRRRIAGVLVRDSSEDCGDDGPCAGAANAEIGPSSRGVKDITEDDVYLYPTGMSAIWNAHHLVSSIKEQARSVCYGFVYTDTLKILEKWGPGALFLGNGLDSDLDTLEAALQKEPMMALFTEFPSNPLLRSGNLPRLRALADKYNFLIVIDETLGNFANVEILPYADIVVSSLSKTFSGATNVMGGSLVLNPSGPHYQKLKAYQSAHFEDLYFDEDAIFMERNSRDFELRVPVIDSNAEAVCELLRSRSLVADTSYSRAVIKKVYYPKWETRANFDKCRVRKDDGSPFGGFGGLFSVTFTSPAASHAFFDCLPCHKGPSLGTNFTLACPYTVLAHYLEMDWAASFGVEKDLVRVAIGLEDKDELLKRFTNALDAAEQAQ